MQMKLLLQSISILYIFELAIKAKLTETELKKIPFFIEMSDRTEEICEGWGERRAERKGEQRGYLWV